MESIGFIILHRKIFDWEWYKDTKTCRLFIHLLLKANFKDAKWQGKEIKRGQLITSINTLKNETSLSEREIRTILNKLKTTNELTIKTTSKYSLITIEKYNLYQSNEIKETNEETNKETSKRQQYNKNNKLKQREEVKEKKKVT